MKSTNRVTLRACLLDSGTVTLRAKRMVDGLRSGERRTKALPPHGGCYGSTTVRRRASIPCLQKFATFGWARTAGRDHSASDTEGVVVQVERAAILAGPPAGLFPQGDVT